jgi:hypothetical protein
LPVAGFCVKIGFLSEETMMTKSELNTFDLVRSECMSKVVELLNVVQNSDLSQELQDEILMDVVEMINESQPV